MKVEIVSRGRKKDKCAAALGAHGLAYLPVDGRARPLGPDAALRPAQQQSITRASLGLEAELGGLHRLLVKLEVEPRDGKSIRKPGCSN